MALINQPTDTARYPLLIFLACAFSIGLYVFSDFRNVGVPEELRVSWRVGPLPVEIFCMILLPLALVVDRRMRLFFQHKLCITIFCLTVYGLFLGLAFGNFFFFMRADIVLFLWFLNGAALMRLLIIARKERPFFICMILVLGLVSVLSVQAETALFRRDDARVGEGLLFRFLNMMVFPAAFIIIWRMKKWWISQLIGWTTVSLMLTISVFFTAARSSILVTLLLIFLILLSLQGLPAHRHSKTTKIAVTVFSALVALGAIGAVVAVATGLYTGGAFALQERLTSEGSVYGRIAEAQAALGSLESYQWIIGGGFGHHFIVPWGDARPTSSMHLAFLDPILKVGLLWFIPFFIFFYLFLPQRYLSCVFKRHRDPLAQIGLLIAYPPVGYVFALMLMSGGLNQHSSVGLGMAFMIYWSASKDPIFRQRLADNFEIGHSVAMRNPAMANPYRPYLANRPHPRSAARHPMIR